MGPSWAKRAPGICVFEGPLHVSVSLFLDCTGHTTFLCPLYSFATTFLYGHRPSKGSRGSYTEAMSPNNLSSSLSHLSQAFHQSDQKKKKNSMQPSFSSYHVSASPILYLLLHSVITFLTSIFNDLIKHISVTCAHLWNHSYRPR